MTNEKIFMNHVKNTSAIIAAWTDPSVDQAIAQSFFAYDY